MVKRMLVDSNHPEETRVVIVDGTKLESFDLETSTKKQNKGNIYLAKIIRVEPSLQAAFVDYGGDRHGFLAFSEIHPDYYQIPVADREALVEEARVHAQSLSSDDEPLISGEKQTDNVKVKYKDIAASRAIPLSSSNILSADVEGAPAAKAEPKTETAPEAKGEPKTEVEKNTALQQKNGLEERSEVDISEPSTTSTVLTEDIQKQSDVDTKDAQKTGVEEVGGDDVEDDDSWDDSSEEEDEDYSF